MAAEPQKELTETQFPDSYVISNTEGVGGFDTQSSWLSPTVLSLHLPSGKKSIQYLQKSMLPNLQKYIGDKPPCLITLQGDFNVNFLDTKVDNDGKDSGEGIIAFLKVLEEFGVTLSAVEMTPEYITEKMRGGYPDSAQALKANSTNSAIKDGAFVLDFTPKGTLSPEQEEVRAEKHKACVEQLMGLKKEISEVRAYPREVSTDHAMVCSKKDGKWFVSHNILSSNLPQNDLYLPENRDTILAAGNALSNFQWRFFADPENQLLSVEEQRKIFGDLDIKTIDFNGTKKEYKVGNEMFTGVELRGALDKAIGSTWKKMFPAKADPNADLKKPKILAKDDDVEKCQAFVRNFYQKCYKSDEFIAYNNLFIHPYNEQELQEIIQYNVDNTDAIKSYMKSGTGGPAKILTYMAMGGVLDPVTPGADMDHKSFIHKCCYQANGGFASPPQKTSEELDRAQAREFFEQAIKKIDGPIGAVDLLECKKGSHTSLLYALIKRIVEISQTRKLSEMNANDFDNEVLKPVKQKIIHATGSSKEPVEAPKTSEGRVKAAIAVIEELKPQPDVKPVAPVASVVRLDREVQKAQLFENAAREQPAAIAARRLEEEEEPQELLKQPNVTIHHATPPPGAAPQADYVQPDPVKEARTKTVGLALMTAINELASQNNKYVQKREAGKESRKTGTMLTGYRLTANTVDIEDAAKTKRPAVLKDLQARLTQAISRADEDAVKTIEREFKLMIRADLLADELAHGVFSISSSSKTGKMLNAVKLDKGRVGKMLNDALNAVNKLEDAASSLASSLFKENGLNEREEQDQAILLYIHTMLANKFSSPEGEERPNMLVNIGQLTAKDISEVKKAWLEEKGNTELLGAFKDDPNALQAVKKALSKLEAKAPGLGL